MKKMTKIMLVNPSQEMGYAYMSGMIPPLNLLSIGTYLKENCADVKVRILDAEVMDRRRLLREVVDSDSRFVAVAINFFNVRSAIRLLRAAKNAGKITIVGGYHVNSCALQLMRKIPQIDFAVIGEGEIPLARLIEGEEPAMIPNLLYRADGSIRANAMMDPMTKRHIPEQVQCQGHMPAIDYGLIENLDVYRNNFQQAYPEYRNPLAIYTHKGCSWRAKTGGCVYCSCPNPKVALKDPTKIWQEIDMLNRKYGAMFVRDVGEDITADTGWLDELHRCRPAHLAGIGFFAYSRVDKIANDENIIRLLVDLNIKDLFIGFESGSQKCLNSLRKGTTVEQNYRCMDKISQSGINIFASFVLGASFENEDDLVQTTAFALDMHTLFGARLKMINFGIMLPYPGTEAFAKLVGIYPGFEDKIAFDAEDLQRRWIKNFCNYSSPDAYGKLRLLCKRMNLMGRTRFSFFDDGDNEPEEDMRWVDDIIRKAQQRCGLS